MTVTAWSEGQKVVAVALIHVADREHEPGHTHCEQEEEGEQVLPEVLEGRRGMVLDPAMISHQHAGDHEQAHQTSPWNKMWPNRDSCGKSKSPRPNEYVRYRVRSPGTVSEVNPAKDQGKRDRSRPQATPHDQHVGEAARLAPFPDKRIQKEYVGKPLEEMGQRVSEMLRSEERFPTAPPVHAGGGPLEPHRVAVGDPERGEQARKGVPDQARHRGV